MDSNDRDRVAQSRAELHGILDDTDIQGVPFVVLANKQDIPNAMSPTQLIDNLGLRRYIGRHEWYVHATCAVTGEGIYEAMDVVGRLAKQEETLKTVEVGEKVEWEFVSSEEIKIHREWRHAVHSTA